MNRKARRHLHSMLSRAVAQGDIQLVAIPKEQPQVLTKQEIADGFIKQLEKLSLGESMTFDRPAPMPDETFTYAYMKAYRELKLAGKIFKTARGEGRTKDTILFFRVD